MLQILRDKAQSIVIQGIVVIIALVFIFWGVGTNMMNTQEAAIVVNDEEISFQDYQQAYDQAYSRIAQQFGGTIPKGLAESLNIKQQVITQLTQQALLRQGGIEMGLLISGHEIQKEIETMIQFQENGQFNLDRYKTILASNRLSPTKFEKSMRYDLLSQKSITSLSNFAVSPSEFEIKDLYNLEKETISVSYAVLSPDTFMPNIEILGTDLEAWESEYQAHITPIEPQQQLAIPREGMFGGEFDPCGWGDMDLADVFDLEPEDREILLGQIATASDPSEAREVVHAYYGAL
jgi:peptidyl-prolyl cis-trans isomerase D